MGIPLTILAYTFSVPGMYVLYVWLGRYIFQAEIGSTVAKHVTPKHTDEDAWPINLSRHPLHEPTGAWSLHISGLSQQTNLGIYNYGN